MPAECRSPVFDTSKSIHLKSAWLWKLYLHPTGDPSGETKQSCIFYTDKCLPICRGPYLIKWVCVHQQIFLKNPFSEQVLKTMVISKIPKSMGKDAQEKNKICSLQRKRTRPSKGTALKHFLLTLCNSSFLLSYLKCFSFLLAQLPTGKKIKKALWHRCLLCVLWN